MLVTCTVLLSLGIQQFDQATAPALAAIEVRPDTVWFRAIPGRAADSSLAYAFVRSTGEWIRAGRSPFEYAPRVPRRGEDRIPVAEGFVLGYVPETSELYESHGIAHALLSDDGGIYPIRQPMSPEDLSRYGDVEIVYGFAGGDRVRDHPVPAPWVGAWTRQGDTLWFGISGGFSEDVTPEAIGGLVRFDLRTRRFEPVWHEDLFEVTFSGLAVAGGALWIGTQYSKGVVRYGLERRSWTRYHTGNSPLPDNNVLALRADGDTVFITTAEGVAFIDTRTGQWSARYFVPSFRGDTLVQELAERPLREDSARRGILSLMFRLKLERRREFLEAASRLPPERFHQVYGSKDGAERALAHPSLVPFLLDALQRPRHPRGLAARALGLLGDRRWIPPLRAQLDSLTVGDGTSVALALGLLGDSTGVQWLRERLAAGDRSAIAAVVRLKDEGSISGLFGVLRPTDSWWLQKPAVQALLEMGGPEARARLLNEASDERLWRGFFYAVRESDAWQADSAFRVGLTALARRALGSSDSWVQAFAGEILIESGDWRAVPYLIAAVGGFSYGDEWATEALIRATGVHWAPVPPRGSAEEREWAQRFWAEWWMDHAHGFRLLSPAEGESALARWRERWRHVEQDPIGTFRRYLGTLDTLDVNSISRAVAYFRSRLADSKSTHLADSGFVAFREFYEQVRRANDRALAFDDSLQGRLSRAKARGDTLLAPDLRAFEQRLARNGFRLSTVETSWTLEVDPVFLYGTFGPHVTVAMREFLALRKQEGEEGFAREGGLTIPFEVLAARVVRWERFLLRNPDFILREDVERLYRDYFRMFLVGSENTRLFDMNTGKIHPSYLAMHRHFAETYSDTKSAVIVSRYLELLEAQGNRWTSWESPVARFLRGQGLSPQYTPYHGP